MKTEKSESIRRDGDGNRLNRYGKEWKKPIQNYRQVEKYSYTEYTEAKYKQCQMVSSEKAESFKNNIRRIRIRRRKNGFDVIILEQIKKEKNEKTLAEHVD